MGAPEEECFSSAGTQLASTHLPEEYLQPPSLILLFPTYLTEKWILTEVAGLYSHLEKKRGTSPGKGGFKFSCKKGVKKKKRKHRRSRQTCLLNHQMRSSSVITCRQHLL